MTTADDVNVYPARVARDRYSGSPVHAARVEVTKVDRVTETADDTRARTACGHVIRHPIDRANDAITCRPCLKQITRRG